MPQVSMTVVKLLVLQTVPVLVFYHAFVYTPSKPGSSAVMTDLGLLPGGGIYSYATAINNSGQIVGYAQTASGMHHAFCYTGGKMTDLGTLPGGIQSVAYGINDIGQIVGVSYDASLMGHAFLYSKGKMTDRHLPGGNESVAYSINNKGQIVGWSKITTWDNGHHAFYTIPHLLPSPPSRAFCWGID